MAAKPTPKPRVRGYPGEIRIIGGQWRSRRLPVPEGEGLRPTPDRVRETLFNWLAPYVSGAACIDLFSGSGALCLEALSRGAARAVMVERSPHVAQQLRANAQTLRAATEVVVADALDYLARPPAPFDLVFLDPPFADAERMIRECSRRLSDGWLADGALVYVEAPRSLMPLPLPAGWEIFKTGVAGQVGYHLVRPPHAGN